MKHNPLKTLCLLLFLTTGWLFAGGLTQDAYAAQGDCATNYGIAVKVMNCVEQSICNSIVGTNCDGSDNTSPITAVPSLQNLTSSTQMVAIKGVAAVMAITLFGLKLMTPSAQYMQQGKPLSDGAKLLFRIAIALYLLWYAPTLFLALINSIGEMIGWVVGTSGSNGMLSNVTASCSGINVDQGGAPSGMNAGEFAIWSMYDCVFYRLVGSGGSSNAIYSSFIALLLPALISAIFYSVSVGILIFCFGVAVLFMMTTILVRSLYVVLLAYISIGFLILLTPLFAPLLMIESEYVSGLFKRWFFQMIGIIFQPVIIVAFMAMAITTIDQFVEGNVASCAVGTSTSVCSFSQLTTGGYSINSFVDPNGFNIIEWYVSGNPQQGAIGELLHGNLIAALAKSAIAVVGQPTVHNVLNALSGAMGLPVLPDLLAATDAQKNLLAQLALTLASLVFVCYIFYKMLDTITKVASSITSSDSISIAGAALPFQNTFSVAGATAKKGMLEAAQGKSFIQGNFGVRDTMTVARAGLIGGLSGAAKGFFGGGGDE